jgi:CheY-like chemotaxis protein
VFRGKKGLRAMRVLLIEDEPTTAKAIELMLTTEGFNVYSTDLGEEGLDLGKLYDYDIILLDLNLPDMHGYDVLKKLRVAKVQTPVLILSGISEMDSKIRSFGFGADAEALDLVLDAGKAGEDQNGGLDLGYPELLEHVVAGHVGQVQVKKDNIVVI